MRRTYTAIVAACAAAVLIAGCGSSGGDAGSGDAGSGDNASSSASNGSASGSAAGGDEGSGSNTLSMYCALPEEECGDYIADFEKDTGIDVESVRLSAGQILARVEAEKGNPQVAVWYGGSTDNFINAAEKGLLAKYVPKDIDQIPEKYRSEDGTWTPFYIGAIGFAVNKEWLDRTGNDAPTSWADLLKPEFADNVMMAHPASSGTAYTVLATLAQMKGTDEAISYLQKLDGNIRQYTTSGAAPGRLAGLGETAVGISFSHDILAVRGEGYPIELTFPSEGTGYEIGAVGLIKDGPADQQANAKKFVDWVISKEGQEAFARDGWFRIPLNPDAEIPDGAQPVSELELIDYDATWAAEHRDSLLKTFSQDVANKSEAKDVG